MSSTEGVAKNRERFDRAMAALDEVHGTVLAALGSVAPDRAARQPAEGEWSLGEIADHLALAERAIADQLAQQATQAPANEHVYAEVVQKRPMRLEDARDVGATGKFTHPPALTPTPGKPLAEVLQALRETRARTKQALAPFRDQDLSVKFFNHRRFGPITLYEYLQFAGYHEQRHLAQIERTLARVAP